MCEYCEASKSLYFNSKAGQYPPEKLEKLSIISNLNTECKEVYIELDGTLVVDFVERAYDKFMDETVLDSSSTVGFKIKYCPMCGKKLDNYKE